MAVRSIFLILFAGWFLQASPAQLTVYHVAFDSEGKLRPATHSRPVTGVIFGKPQTNAVVHFGYPERLSEVEEEGRWELPRPEIQFQVDHWDREHGLPANKVTAVIEAEDGYRWIGTVEGLARFDGARFVTFTEENELEMARRNS